MLSVHDLAARRGHSELFAGVAFSVPQGEALVVTGANGAGKTTLLRILAGLSAPARGETLWQGIRYKPFDERIRAAIAFVGHAPSLKDELTTEENLVALATLAGERPAPGEIDEALAVVALSRQRALPARSLSQGQRRRIGLARLRLVKRPLWILDEPVTALDAAGAALMESLMAAHLDRGGIAIAATHQPLGLPPARCGSLALT
ncbi:MAG TPA: cytochrome c biogenesis heme-transporting ATPase CcmA [Casimicrobiaceae bacterium]|nr:cytochrome c biogenesis heme-transporting ATPase CcmA [Casimicrobiaceae bacterium]